MEFRSLVTDHAEGGDEAQPPAEEFAAVPAAADDSVAVDQDPTLLSNIKSPRADASAPWMKDEVDEFEDLQDKDIDKFREDKADKALIHAVKTIAELTRDQTLNAYSNHPRVTPRY